MTPDQTQVFDVQYIKEHVNLDHSAGSAHSASLIAVGENNQ